MSKINVAIIFGGRSSEHEISLLSAQNILKGLNKKKYNPILVGIDKNGKWFYNEESISLLHANDAKRIKIDNSAHEVVISQNATTHDLISRGTGENIAKIDVIFPILHGAYGEDGSIQGLAKMANIPCVGPNILGSAMGMDKDIMKRLLRDYGIPNAPFVTLRDYHKSKINYQEISELLGHNLFIKPVNLGSSVGISFTHNEEEFHKGVEYAFQFDQKVLVESQIIGREIECAVLGNDDPQASIPGEVIPKGGFYSYENKYLDENGAVLVLPAKLNPDEVQQIQKLAIETFRILECSGMARVDMFLTPDGELFINEINTIPGFTSISMYPKLWELSGLPVEKLLDKLIQLAIEKHGKENTLTFRNQ